MSSPETSPSENATQCAVLTQLRPRRTRSKTGCTCCRLRKKKCDETRPICGGCRRLGFICSWIDSKEFSWRKNRGLSATGSIHTTSSDSLIGLSSLDSHSSYDSEGSYGLDAEVVVNIAGALPVLPASRLHATYLLYASSLYDLWPHTIRVLDLEDPIEQKLLQLFIERTTPLLFCQAEAYTPLFVLQLLDWAFSDSLIMNGVLAVATCCLGCDTESAPMEAKRLQCYGNTVKELKFCLTKWDGLDAEEAFRLLTTTYLLILHEWIQGNETGTATVVQHLRASRQFATVVLANTKHYGSRRILSGLVIEQYAYFEFCSNFCLPPNEEHFDIHWHSPVLQLDNLREFQTFGALLGCASSLYQLIPMICQLAVARQAEIEEHVSLDCSHEFDRLYGLIWGWHPEEDPAQSSRLSEECKQAGRIMQITLQLFLFSAYYGTEYDGVNYCRVREVARTLVSEATDIAKRTWFSSWSNANYWFIIIIASYAVDDDQQRECLEYIAEDWPLARAMRKCLTWLWARPEEAYGLEGLTRAQKVLQINVLLN